ncbi:hypothetical protein H2200_002136 [Cladophialophora chaetospira]|uniref:Uncharacterized protein n=1 Tax=Cladophialophora chaetospira TaxID=386627 RepID=A0AA39CN84_9EURO|nr:hypothetical protein H2200_002136 [Cladophialophora chaetospira]
MTSTKSLDEFPPEASDTEVEVVGPPDSSQIPDLSSAPNLNDIPDLSSVPGSELRRLTENIAASIEGHDGAIYHSIYRQLQIRPDKYYDFNNGVVRFTRNKHFAEIRKGTNAGIRMATGLLLRGFGFKVWRKGSDWLIDESELDEGEARFVYERKKEHVPDARFYPILSTLWRQMRNIMFEHKGTPVRKGRPPGAAPAALSDGEDSYMGDVDSSRAPSPHTRARATATKKIESLAAKLAKRLPTPKSRMSVDQTEEAIIDLIVRLAEVRENSDPKAFAELWEMHILRVDEVEDEDALDDALAAHIVGTTQPTTSASNEPFNTTGVPQAHSFPSSLPLPPTLPALMSIYISTASMLPPTNHTAAAPTTQSYHWPSAPVENHSFVNFFTGVNYRVDVAPSSILG